MDGGRDRTYRIFLIKANSNQLFLVKMKLVLLKLFFYKQHNLTYFFCVNLNCLSFIISHLTAIYDIHDLGLFR